MQTIKTYYLPATNTKGARIKAKCQGGSVTLGWEYSISNGDNHIEAARELCEKLNWHGELVTGFEYDGTQNWVFVREGEHITV